MEPAEGTSRRSERKRKRKEIYTPEGKNEGGKKNKPEGQKSQYKSKFYPNRLFDVLPNGEPFSCHLCKSPYVVNPISKGVKKTRRSRHLPLPQVRTDRNTGREMILCNACVQIFDRPQRRVVKTVIVPSEEEKKKYLQDVDLFIKTLKAEFDDPLVEKLFCPLSQKKLCGCLQKYIQSTGNSHVPVFLTLMKEAVELRKEKSYPITDDNRKVKLIGLGNGHKKSKRYEEFVLTKRRVLKEDMRLCERATQKILIYSNNFLHKRLKTENRPCRIERTRGKAALGQLPDLHTMMDLHCCSDNCVMLALTHKRLLQDWRDRALQGQQEARRVMAEMLTPAGATHINCYTFISMVTGCSPATIARVYNQMIETGGLRDPPEHGMKRVWQEHYKQTRTFQKNKDTSSSTVSAESLAQEVTSSHSQTNQNTVTDTATLNEVRQHKLAWMQDIAKKQLEQQQLALHLQELMNKKKQSISIPYQNTTVQQSALLHKPDDHLMKANSIGLEQLQHMPLSAVFGLNPTLVNSQGHIITGQGHQLSSQGQIQQVLLQPPPQYGVNQSNIERQWNQSHFTFPINVNQTNYIVTGDKQVLPVIPVFKHGTDGQMVTTHAPSVSEMQDVNGSQIRSLQISLSQPETIQNLDPAAGNQLSSLISNQTTSENTSNSEIKNTHSSLHNQVQTEVLRQYHIVEDQEVPLLNYQTPDIEQGIGENVTSEDPNPEHSDQFTSSPNVHEQSENINPNMYLQILPETPLQTKVFTAEKIENLTVSKSTTSLQNNGCDFIAQPMPSFEHLPENELLKEKNTDKTQHGLTENTDQSGLQKLSEENIVTNGTIVENNSTAILDSFTNQVDQTFQQENQAQLIVPVSFFPASDTNEVSNEQIPSQIQISFQTCSTESNQPGFTQQIILPHGNVVTLPLMPVNSSKEVDLTKTLLVNTSKENNAFPENSTESCIVVQGSTETSLSRENLEQHLLNERPKVLAVDKVSKTEPKTVKSRNSSGTSKKSRNFSGSSEKSRKSIVHFSDADKSESHQETGHSILRPDHLPDVHFVSKLNKGRHRQYSGNSDHGDRSRKSSGNSVFSETSSHTSGFTLSNLASPNIFHDKEKGIFFIQSIDGLELNEIDSNHLVDFIQAVEADQTNTVDEKNNNCSETQSSDLEEQEFNQSVKPETDNFNQSRNTHIERTVGMKDAAGNNIHNHLDSQNVSVQKTGNNGNENSTHSSKLYEYFPERSNISQFDDKHNEETYTENADGHLQSRTKSSGKKKDRQTNKTNAVNKKQTTQDRLSENFSSNMQLPKDKGQHHGIMSPSKSFVPIAPKGTERIWTVDTSVSVESNNNPVLRSLLARKPMLRLYE